VELCHWCGDSHEHQEKNGLQIISWSTFLFQNRRKRHKPTGPAIVFISIDPQYPHIKVGENMMEREMLILMFIFDGYSPWLSAEPKVKKSGLEFWGEYHTFMANLNFFCIQSETLTPWVSKMFWTLSQKCLGLPPTRRQRHVVRACPCGATSPALPRARIPAARCIGKPAMGTAHPAPQTQGQRVRTVAIRWRKMWPGWVRDGFVGLYTRTKDFF